MSLKVREKYNHFQTLKKFFGNLVFYTQSLIFLATFTMRGEALKLLKVSVPDYKLRGEMAILECDYELEGEVLYAVKWYKDNEEFYRFVPKASPSQNSYKVDGIKVDHQMSNSKQVVLRGVNLKSSGLYRCEVSAEAPSFSSAQDEGRLDVFYLPKDGPYITGEKEAYQVGDKLFLNCTSGKSYPASTLQWYINDNKISNPEDLVLYPNTVHSYGLLTTSLGLKLNVANSHFAKGQMKLKCVASISAILWQGNRESVVQRLAPLIDNREAHFLVKGAAIQNIPVRFLILIILLIQFWAIF